MQYTKVEDTECGKKLAKEGDMFKLDCYVNRYAIFENQYRFLIFSDQSMANSIEVAVTKNSLKVFTKINYALGKQSICRIILIGKIVGNDVYGNTSCKKTLSLQVESDKQIEYAD